jgi:transposase-like protein
MEEYPRNVQEFQQWFGTEDSCRQYLFRLRWPNGFRCPRCEHDRAWPVRRDLWHCVECGFETSVIAGTIFQDTRKPLRLWFQAMWYVTSQKQGMSALGLQRVLGLGSYPTAWTWLHKLRRAMVRPGRDRLQGTVEADETFIGGPRPGKPGRGAAGKVLILIVAEQDGNRIGRIRLRRISDASAESLEGALREIVEPGTLVVTDAWLGYNGLEAQGYYHEAIRKSSIVGDNLLPLANRVASLLKRWLLGTHQGAVRTSHLDYYLDEFTFRFNRRTSGSRGKLFYRLAQQAMMIEPVPGKIIFGERPET